MLALALLQGRILLAVAVCAHGQRRGPGPTLPRCRLLGDLGLFSVHSGDNPGAALVFVNELSKKLISSKI